MASSGRVLLLSFVMFWIASAARAQCPQIPNFRINNTVSSTTITWDAPAGITNPTYEIMQSTRGAYCPGPAADSFQPIATTQLRTYTFPKQTPDTVWSTYVRVQSNPCSASVYYGGDSFSVPPQAPVIVDARVVANTVEVKVNQSDPKTVSLWLFRVDDQKFIGDISACGSNPKTLVDPARPAAASVGYQVIAYNTGNTAGLNGVRSEIVRVSTSAPPPEVSFSASPDTIRAGQSTTLAWRVTNASSVAIDQGIGSEALAGARTVAPGQTTTYTLTATGSTTVTASVVVTVATAPRVVVSAAPGAMLQSPNSGPSTTSYSLTNAGGSPTAITLSRSGVFFDHSPASFTLAPGQTQVITITAAPAAAGFYEGSSIPSGNGVPAGTSVPVRLASTSVPSQPAVAVPGRTRVDVSSEPGQAAAGTVTYANTGSGTVRGVLTADVPWIKPQEGVVTIAPGASGSFTFTIDRALRPDSDAPTGSRTGNVSLLYFGGAAGNSVSGFDTAPTVSLVTVVDTVKLNATPGAPPPLAANEVALFVPGVGHVQGSVGLFISDFSLANPANKRVDDLRFYYTPATGAAGVQKTVAVPALQSSNSYRFADVVKSVFSNEGQVGSLMIRSTLADKLNVATTVFNSSNPAGTYGTTIPTMRSDRSVPAGDTLVLTGLRSDAVTHTNLYFQETGGGTVTVDTQFLALDGSVVGTRSDSIAAFGVTTANAVVPAGAVAAVMTNRSGSSGKFLSFATPVDKRSGDTWAVADWRRQYGYGPSDPVVIPVAGTLRGANNTFFRTDLSITNAGNGTGAANIRFVSPGSAPVERRVTVGSKQTVPYADIVGTLLGLSSTSGYLIVAPENAALNVSSRTYATVGDDPATYGTHVPALATAAALKLGASRTFAALDDAAASTIAARRPGTFRTNIGLAETAGKSATVRITLRFSYPAGSKVEAVGSASKDYVLNANQFLQINGITADVLGDGRASLGDLRDVKADIQVVSGEGEVTVFTSSVDNGTADSILRTE